MLDLINANEKSNLINAAPLYPYDFPTSGFARIDKTRFLIEDQSEWDYCEDARALIENNAAAARRYGLNHRVGTEKAMLSSLLIKLKAGPHIMTYAWGLYSDMLKSGTHNH